VVGEAARTARNWNAAEVPVAAAVDTAIRAVAVTVVPGATVTETGETVEVNTVAPLTSAADHVKVELPQADPSVLRTERVTVDEEPRGTNTYVAEAVATGVPRTQPGPGVGVGAEVGVGVGPGVPDGVGVGVGLPPAAAATAFAASTIPVPQPPEQPLGPKGCAVCCM